MCDRQNIAPLKMWLLESVNRLLYMAKGTLQMEMKGLEMGRLSWLAQSCPALCNPMDCSIPGLLSISNSWSLLKFTSIESVMPSNHLILCRPPFLLPSVFPSIRIFSTELLLCIRWPEYCWSFSFSISPSNEYSRLISFRMDWFDLLAFQGTMKSLQHHNSKVSVLWHSAFFIVQLSHPYMTTGKTITLTRWIFVGKVMSMLFNMLSRLVIAFLPRSKNLLISWLQSPFAVIVEPKKIKSVNVSPIYLP